MSPPINIKFLKKNANSDNELCQKKRLDEYFDFRERRKFLCRERTVDVIANVTTIDKINNDKKK